MTVIKTKTTYKKALGLARVSTNSEKEALDLVQKQIDLGLVGDPNKRKTCGWSFTNTDMTFHPNSRYPARSKKRGANNTKTDEIKLVAKLMGIGFDSVYGYIKGLHQEGEFSSIDTGVYIDRYKDSVVEASKQGIYKFLKTKKED